LYLKYKLKVLFILHYPPPVHGSAVVGGFIKESKVINNGFDCHYINLGTSESVEDIGRNSIKKLSRYLSLIWQVKRQLIMHRLNICYLTPTAAGPGFYKDAILIAIVKLFGVKTVFHYHNKGISSRQKHHFDNFLYRMAFKNTSVILLSKHLYPDIQRYVPEDRVYYCPNGIPDVKGERQKEKGESRSVEQREESGESEKGYSVFGNQYSVKENEKLKTKNSTAVEVLFLSHLIRSKGVLVLIDACDLLRERGADFHCTIAGGDAELTKREVETIVSDKGLSSLISVVGPKHGDEKAEIMNTVDIFVHPTYNDCLPLVLLEAMQYSLPVVSTYEGAIPDVVNDGVTGFLVQQRDADALANKLELLIRDPEQRLKMGKAGRAKYEREFTLEKFENRLKEILEEVGSAQSALKCLKLKEVLQS
jgi:glycosyltransferase involved in cell wall biosynthesis